MASGSMPSRPRPEASGCTSRRNAERGAGSPPSAGGAAAGGWGRRRSGSRGPSGSRPRRISSSRFRLVAERIRASTVRLRLSPRRRTSLSWSVRSSLTWSDGGISPISSRKSVPPVAASNRPGLSRSAPVNAPLTYPNSSDSSRFSGMAPQFTGDERAVAAVALVVDQAGDELLAGAALAGDQDGRRVGERPWWRSPPPSSWRAPWR